MSAWAPTAVYVLCFVASAACALLLTRAWMTNRSRLLLWTAVSFGFLTLNNLMLVADMVIFPTIDFWIWRQVAAAAALVTLLIAFIWEAR